ncbi:hypothetical protein R3P38DRAFT_3242964 [Favolaschia claudopus]|uniref:RING-type domain-containing protein n=1 Tax=Favolaschia claudopus TaxID=2862362 RepID=A0AAV9Z3I2_9AGAR
MSSSSSPLPRSPHRLLQIQLKLKKLCPLPQMQLTTSLQLRAPPQRQIRRATTQRQLTLPYLRLSGSGTASSSTSTSTSLSSSPAKLKQSYSNELFVGGISPDDETTLNRTLPSDSTYSCSICQSLLVHPVAIPCHPTKAHIFCFHCLRKALDTSKQCPLCRKLVTAPPTYVEDLATALAAIFPEQQSSTQVIWSKAWDGVAF